MIRSRPGVQDARQHEAVPHVFARRTVIAAPNAFSGLQTPFT